MKYCNSQRSGLEQVLPVFGGERIELFVDKEMAGPYISMQILVTLFISCASDQLNASSRNFEL